MNVIQLNQDRRDKLIEMVKVLFPEFSNVRFGKGWERYNVWLDNIPNSKPDPIEIHWFELCVTELPDRLFKTLNKIVDDKINRTKEQQDRIYELYEPELIVLDVLDLLIMGSKHPVDTLWNEFKKLKLWNSEIGNPTSQNKT